VASPGTTHSMFARAEAAEKRGARRALGTDEPEPTSPSGNVPAAKVEISDPRAAGHGVSD